jgi:diguanylate cyclase (GGDEF)-like protein
LTPHSPPQKGVFALIDVYLLILSVSYTSQAYSPLAALFLMSTSLLLFGAFYTSFSHGVRMSVMIRYEEKSRLLEQELRQSLRDVDELKCFAFTDALTDIHNRRYCMEALNHLIDREQTFCVCFIDIDHLKYVNDRYGHNEGDQYILSVVRTLSGCFRQSDRLCRLGGDEFVILLTDMTGEGACQRIQEAYGYILRLPAAYAPSISYGLVEIQQFQGLSASQVLQMADEEMYRFKQAHRQDFPR